MYTCKLTDTRWKRLLNRRERGEGKDRMGFRYKKKVCVASSGVRLFRERVVEGSGGQVFQIDNSAREGRKDRVAIVIKIKFN